MPKDQKGAPSLEQRAAQLSSDDMIVPFARHIVTDLGVAFVDFIERRWSPEKDSTTSAVLRPGLQSAAVPSWTKEGLKGDLLELLDAVRAASGEWIDATANREKSRDRAGEIIVELRTVLSWYFSVRADEGQQRMLSTVLSQHAAQPSNAPALASKLDDLLGIAKPLAKQLDGVGGFDSAVIDEGERLVGQLRGRVKAGAAGLATQDELATLERRNRYIALLYKSVTELQNAAKFVFRKHPEVLAEIPVAAVTVRRKKKGEKGKPEEGKQGEQKPAPQPAPVG